MPDAFRTLILPAAHAPLARELAASFGTGGAGMWTTPLSADGNDPATHYISTGGVPPEFGYMVPYQQWELDEQGNWTLIATEPGNAQAVWYNATEQGVQCTLAEVEAIFAAADVTEQLPFTAMARLGLQIINPPEDI